MTVYVQRVKRSPQQNNEDDDLEQIDTTKKKRQRGLSERSKNMMNQRDEDMAEGESNVEQQVA